MNVVFLLLRGELMELYMGLLGRVPVVWCVGWWGEVRCNVRCGVWGGVARRGAARRGVARCGVVRCGVVWCGAVRCGVVWCGMLLYGMV